VHRILPKPPLVDSLSNCPYALVVNSEADSHRVRIQTLESELHYLQGRTRATIEQLQEYRAKLAAIRGVIAFPQIPRSAS
jgi:hypothetical protein